MKITLKILTVFLCLLALSGCASKYYQVSPENYRERVKVLGVLPLIVDADSTILHPQRAEVVALLQKSATDKYLHLSAQLSESAGYREVRPVIIDMPSALQLFAGKTLKTNKSGTFRTYRPDTAAVAALAQSAGVDGFLVVILNGVDNKGKRGERVGLRYLEANFNEIQATAMVLGASGEILWERPGTSDGPFVDLQYVDFGEAYYNRTDQVSVRFITSDGLNRTLQASEKGLFDKEPFPILYRRLFTNLSESLAVGKLWRN